MGAIAASTCARARSRDELAVAVDVGVHVGERAPVAGQAEARTEPLDDVQRVRGIRRPGRASSRSRSTARCARAGGRRRSAAAARAGRGRRARARGRASRARSRRRGRWRPRRRAAGRGRARSTPAMPGFVVLALARRSGAAAPRGRRSGARPRGAASSAASGSSSHCGHVLVVGVHPQLAAGALDDRGGLPVVVGVGVRADDQADVLEAQVAHRERALELRQRAGLVHAGVEQHDAVAGGHRPGVAVRARRATAAAGAGG